jgi:3'(2'), 5'-bisphosphate nucleotidase
MIKELSNFEEILYSSGQILLQKKQEYQKSYEIIGSQVKSVADREVHSYLINNIKRIKKDVPIVSEEDLSAIPASKVKALKEFFIIDPIDGTASYIHGYKGYVTQMAFIKDGIPVFSIVYGPELDEMYTAVKGGGSYLNGQMVNIEERVTPPIFIDNYPEPSVKIKKMMEYNPGSLYVECGSIGLKICRIAQGKADIFYKDVCLRDWDLIPPLLVLEEAGGSSITLQKEKIKYFENDDYAHYGLFAMSHSDLERNLDILENINP